MLEYSFSVAIVSDKCLVCRVVIKLTRLHGSPWVMIKYHGIGVHDMSLDSLMVSSIMTHDVKTEKEDQNIMAACKVMNDNNIGCVIIVKIKIRRNYL